MLILTGLKRLKIPNSSTLCFGGVSILREASASLLFLFFILMVRGLYDGVRVEAFFCLLAAVL